MNTRTKQTLALASKMAASGFDIPGIEVHTPDGRTWNIGTVPAGRGRHLDGHWGPRPGALPGFRLFEVNADRETIDEHDAVDGDTWTIDEIVEYLNAVGAEKNLAKVPRERKYEAHKSAMADGPAPDHL